MRYKAFISYNHSSRGLARALQDALYRFGTPWYERSGPKIFRDESGLAVNPDLWGILRAALDESEYFIYLASPESAQAYYTRNESEYWLQQRGPDQVILALAKGNILWDEKAAAFDPELSDALPEVLRSAFGHVPLFVDLRGIAETNWQLTDPVFRDKVATIASTLHGRSKDELYGMQVSALIMSDAERMARDAQAALAERLSDRALLLAAHALRLTEAQGEPRVPDVEAALRQILCRVGGRPLGDLDGRARPAFCMSSDGRWLCTIHDGGETKLWDLTTADEATFEPTWICPMPEPDWLHLSSDGSWLVAINQPSEGGSSNVQLWDMRTTPPQQVALSYEGSIVQVDVSPSGDYLALSTVAPTRVLVWYLPPRPDSDPSSTQPDTFSLVLDQLHRQVMRLAFAPDSATLCAFDDSEVKVWQLSSEAADEGREFHQETGPIDDCRATPGGDTLLMLANKTPQVVTLSPGGDAERRVIQELDDDIIHRLEISPDGRWGLLLSDSGPSYVVELARPTENGFTITSAGGTMNRHEFSRNGHWLATAAGPMEKYPELQVEEPEFIVRLRNLLVPQSLGEIELAGHDDLITDVTFSPDGDILATCSVDKAVRLWDLSELNAWSGLLARLLNESDPEVMIREFGFSPDEIAQQLQEALEQVQEQLVEAAKRFRARQPRVLLADDGAPLSCAFSSDGSRLVSTHFKSQARWSARLWDIGSNSPCAGPIYLSNSAKIDNFDLNQTCVLSRNGRWVFILGNSAVWELRAENGDALDRPALGDVGQVEIDHAEFNPGGDLLLLYAGQKLLLLDLVNDEDLATLDTGDLPVRAAFFTGDDRWVIAECGSSSSDDPADVRAWPLQQAGDHRASFVAVRGSRTLNVCTTSPGGRWLLASDDTATSIWDLRRDEPGGSERRLSGHSGPIAEVCWTPDEQGLISAGVDGRLLFWPLGDTGHDLTPELLYASDGPFGSVTADWRQLRVFAGGRDGQARLLNLNAQRDVTGHWDPQGLTGDVSGYFSDSGRWLATWDRNAVRVFQSEGLVERLVLPNDPDQIQVGSTWRYSPDERWLVVARQGRLFLADLRANPPQAFIELTGHRHDVIVFRMTSDSHWLVSIDRPLTEPAGFAPLQTCRIWDLWSPIPARSGVVLPDLDLGVDRIEITPDDRWLITSSRDGVRAWPLGTEHLLAVAQRSLGREPSDEERRRYAFTTLESPGA